MSNNLFYKNIKKIYSSLPILLLTYQNVHNALFNAPLELLVLWLLRGKWLCFSRILIPLYTKDVTNNKTHQEQQEERQDQVQQLDGSKRQFPGPSRTSFVSPPVYASFPRSRHWWQLTLDHWGLHPSALVVSHCRPPHPPASIPPPYR